MVETAPFSGGLSIRSGTDPASFLGRTQELELIRQLLVEGTSQLLTLVGPAGVGKTRLALEVATRFSDAFPDGVWFVDLAPLSDPAAVPAAIAQSLGLTGMDARDPLDRVSAYLHVRTALLILDNLEQILPAAPLNKKRPAHAGKDMAFSPPGESSASSTRCCPCCDGYLPAAARRGLRRWLPQSG